MRRRLLDSTRSHSRCVLFLGLTLACAPLGCGGSGSGSQLDATDPGDHVAAAIGAPEDAGVNPADVAATDGRGDPPADAGSDRSPGLQDARDARPDLPPTCPTYPTSPCPLPGLVCYLGTGGSQTSKCTCLEMGDWACLPITPPPPPPPSLPFDAAADASLAGPDGGFTNTCVDCLRADRCQGNDPTAGTSITSECVALSDSMLGFGQQVVANCQATIYQLHCP